MQGKIPKFFEIKTIHRYFIIIFLNTFNKDISSSDTFKKICELLTERILLIYAQEKQLNQIILF
jgi:hypothetical protein